MSSLWQRYRQGPYRWPLRFAIVLLLGGAALVWFIFWGSRQPLSVENRSGQALPHLQITVGGQTVTYQNLPAGGQASIPFSVREGDAYTVEGELADGNRVRVVGKLGPATRLLILPAGEVKFVPAGARGGLGVWRTAPRPSRMAA